MVTRASLVIALVAADAPPHIQQALRDVQFSGGLADPFTEFLDSRWENVLTTPPHVRVRARTQSLAAGLSIGKDDDHDMPCDPSDDDDDAVCTALPDEFSWCVRPPAAAAVLVTKLRPRRLSPPPAPPPPIK